MLPLKVISTTLLEVLIEVDISTKLVESLMIERVGKSFFIEIAYKNLSAFCLICSSIAHLPSDYRLNKSKESKPNANVSKTKLEVGNTPERVPSFHDVTVPKKAPLHTEAMVPYNVVDVSILTDKPVDISVYAVNELVDDLNRVVYDPFIANLLRF